MQCRGARAMYAVTRCLGYVCGDTLLGLCMLCLGVWAQHLLYSKPCKNASHCPKSGNCCHLYHRAHGQFALYCQSLKYVDNCSDSTELRDVLPILTY